MGKILAAVALALAVAAMAINFVIPGPAGPAGAAGTNGTNGTNGAIGPAGPAGPTGATGATRPAGPTGAQGPPGPPGPSGNGTLMTSVVCTTPTSIQMCANLASVTINAPTTGNIIVTSQVHLWIDHTTGTTDGAWIRHALAPTDCGAPFGAVGCAMEIHSSVGTAGLVNMNCMTETVYQVTIPGSQTFYLNGSMFSGASANDRAAEWVTVAVFYPS